MGAVARGGAASGGAVEAVEAEEGLCVLVACGAGVTIAVSDEGETYAWGEGGGVPRGCLSLLCEALQAPDP